VLIAMQVYVWQQNLHAARAFAPQHIGFILHAAMLIAEVVFGGLGFLRTFAVVENSKLGPQKIRPHLSQIPMY